MRKWLLLIVAGLGLSTGLIAQGRIHSIPSIQVYNPTDIKIRSLVEIPVGSLASPGLIIWQDMHLEVNGATIPHSLKEGRPHWKASLESPLRDPRAEDLLIFSIELAPRQWQEIKIEKGKRASANAFRRDAGFLVITYENTIIRIDERSGMLSDIVMNGDSITKAPLNIQFFKTNDSIISLHGNVNPGNRPAWLTVNPHESLPGNDVRLVSSSSDALMTELNFVLRHQKEIAAALTYRIYSNQTLEICFDERPWSGKSPWTSFGAKLQFALQGAPIDLRGFQSYFPYYGFKEYACAVNNIGRVYWQNHSKVFEFGEEALNGRFWKRKIAVYTANIPFADDQIANLLDEGLIIVPQPLTAEGFPENVRIEHDDSDSSLADKLKQAITTRNHPRQKESVKEEIKVIRLVNVTPGKIRNISGDGFSITRDGQVISISAATRFGLFQGVSAIIESFYRSNTMKIPLIASNPAIDLRAGGFGGGNIEVDFPYEDKQSWRHALNGMMTSGMNSMTDLGMWSNWKMPVTFKYMPELQSDHADAYDEVSGARFSSYDSHRVFALEQIEYLHRNGVKVWLWIPVGAVPTTFENKYPDAMAPSKKKTPRFTHPEYKRYLTAYFKELFEIYPVDGLVLIRDDNGGIDDTPEFREYLEKTETKDPVWEQYAFIKKLVASLHFKGTVAVYPYFDLYKPILEEKIDKDLLIIGHGSGLGVLTRNYEKLGTMPDTWLDNLFSGFRIPPVPRMKRMLSERGSYWIGGAYYGMELPWLSIGYFGRQPSATVNSFRFDFASNHLNKESILDYVDFADVCDDLWEVMNTSLFPPVWFTLSDSARKSVQQHARSLLTRYHKHLNALREKNSPDDNGRWFAQTILYADYFSYHLERATIASEMQKIASPCHAHVLAGKKLPKEIRSQLEDRNEKIYDLALAFDRKVKNTPGGMLQQLSRQGYTIPFKEQVYGYNGYPVAVDQLLPMKQFDADIQVHVDTIFQGKPFQIQVTLRNTGFMSWMPDEENKLSINGHSDSFQFSIPKSFIKNPIAFGDSITLYIDGKCPPGHGSETVEVQCYSPFFHNHLMGPRKQIQLNW